MKYCIFTGHIRYMIIVSFLCVQLVHKAHSITFLTDKFPVDNEIQVHKNM